MKNVKKGFAIKRKIWIQKKNLDTLEEEIEKYEQFVDNDKAYSYDNINENLKEIWKAINEEASKIKNDDATGEYGLFYSYEGGNEESSKIDNDVSLQSSTETRITPSRVFVKNNEDSTESNEKTPLIRNKEQESKSKSVSQRIQEFKTDTNSSVDDYTIGRMNEITQFVKNCTYEFEKMSYHWNDLI